MPSKLPDIHEDDRHIAPMSMRKADITVGEDVKFGEDEPELLDDGSAVFTIEGDEETTHTPEFLDNLADVFDPVELRGVATELLDHIEHDLESRLKRDKQYEEGLRRTGLGDDAPGGAGFSGASRVVHPILAESCIDFESRAIKELFPASGPVKTHIVGKKTEEKLDRAERKVRFLNWQMTSQMSEYRPTMEQVLTQVPMAGSQYQKFWYDEDLERPRTAFLPIDNVILPYACTDFYSSHRVTEREYITKQELEQRIEAGLYLDIQGGYSVPATEVELTASKSANDKIEGADQDGYNEDGQRVLYHVYTWSKFEDDDITEGKLAPYIITIDKHTEQVLAVYRNWEESDVKLRKLDWIIEWQFIPWRGAYGIGLPHLIGGLSGAATGALRALMDSAHINNAATLIKLKGGKNAGDNIEVEPTQIANVDAPPGVDDIRKVIMAMPYNPPSTVLFQLLGWLTDAGKGVIATTEEAMNGIGDRTPVGTTMAMVEQGSATYSAIHARLHYSQAKALQILCRINAMYLDDNVQIDELDELIVSRADFQNSRDIIPVSDPNIFSETQRFAQMQGVAQVRAMFPNQAFNENMLARTMLKRLRVENVDEILPPEKKAQNMNPVAENVAALHGTPLLALPNQDHMAHIMAHMEFASSPVFKNPIMGSKLLPTIIEHVKQHIAFYYSSAMDKMTAFSKMGDKVPTKVMEQRMANAQHTFMPEMAAQMQAVLMGLQELQQAAQQFQPPMPMDPSIQATKEVAMADIQRKTQRDQAEIEILKQEKLQLNPAADQRKHETALLNNQLDNQQHQQTELQKNTEDNITARIIAAMKLEKEEEQRRQEQDLAMRQAAMADEQAREQHQVDTAAQLAMHEREQQLAADQHARDQEAALEQAKSQPSQPTE